MRRVAVGLAGAVGEAFQQREVGCKLGVGEGLDDGVGEEIGEEVG